MTTQLQDKLRAAILQLQKAKEEYTLSFIEEVLNTLSSITLNESGQVANKSKCLVEMRAGGGTAFPRSCFECGLGPCKFGAQQSIRPQRTDANTISDLTVSEVNALKKDAKLYRKLRAMNWKNDELCVIRTKDLNLGIQTYNSELLDIAIEQGKAEDK